MEDHALPFMSDLTHAEDTWFLVAEEDYRITEEHCQPAEGRKPDLTMDHEHESWLRGNFDDLYRTRLSDAPLRGRDAFQPTELSADATYEAAGLGFFRRTTKACAQEFEDVSLYLQDLLHMATAAHRGGQGGLVVYAWDGPSDSDSRRRKSVPMHGSTLIGLTAKAARVMAANFDDWFELHHWDVSLFKCLETNPAMREAIGGSCFAYPSVGHYTPHVSGTEGIVRDPAWDMAWCQSGTRVEDRRTQHERRLCAWSTRGVPPVVSRLQLPTDAFPDVRSLDWMTEQPPLGRPECAALRRRGGRGAGGKGKSRGRAFSHRGRTTPGLEGLQWSNVVDADEEGETQTQSAERRRRSYLHLYSFRNFTPVAAEAC